MLAKAIMLNAWAISVFFLRFWKRTRDRLFLWFAMAFLLLGIEWLGISAVNDARFHLYLIRLLAFLMIIYAIWEKNRGKSRV